MTADKDFFIYADRSKLHSFSNTEYRVEKTVAFKDLKSAIKRCANELRSQGPQATVTNFNTLFSVIEFTEQIDYNDLHYVYDELIVQNFNLIGSFFTSYGGDIEDIDVDIRHQFTNIIKMSIYLFAEFVNSFSSKIETDYKLLVLEQKGKNKKKDIVQKHTTDYHWDWEEKLCMGFKAINNVITHNITHLYDPPYIDHTFVSYLASCCYTRLENPSIALVRSKPLLDSIMQILVVLITDYDHGKDFKVEVVKLLKYYEHLSLPLAKAIIQIVESGTNRSSLIELIVKEIGDTGLVDGIKESNNLETNGGKSCCALLVEIAKQCPKILLPNIEHLLPCLESDPYTMRICVLSVLKELIIHVLNSDALDEAERKTRDDYLFILHDHLLDVNAFVRSKALQLLTDIIDKGCLPKDMYKLILNSTTEKLYDKSSYVTKSAIQLIKSFIKSNPYCDNFTEEILQDKIKIEICSLKELEQKLKNQTVYYEASKEDKWMTIETPLKLFLEETLKDCDLESFDKLGIIENKELSDVLIKIKSFLSRHKFKKALKVVLQGKETFKNEQLFKLQNTENLSEQFVLLFKNIWCYENTVSQEVLNENCEVEQTIDAQLFANILLTKSKIAYLQEYAEYLGTIKKALNTIKELMFGNTMSESIEAIDFFTTAYQFNIPHTQNGIRAILSLIDSNDNHIKEATVKAYKKVYLTVDDTTDVSTRTMTIMTKLVNLVKNLNVTNRKSFELLLLEWINNETLDKDCIKLLWMVFTKSINTSHKDRVIAALILSMVTSAKPSIAKANINNLIWFGLCNCNECKDYQLFIYTCQILKQITKENFMRFPVKHEIVKRILSIVQTCFDEGNVQLFNDVALNAVNIIYKLTVKPNITSKKLIENCYNSMTAKNVSKGFSEKETDIFVDNDLLAKFIFLIGQIALEQSEFLEDYVAKELIQIVKTKYQSKKSNTNIESVFDSEGAAVERINKRIRQTCNKQLICENETLSYFVNYIINSCSANDPILKSNAAISLIKYMMVSESFCQKNMPLFLSLLEESDSKEMSIDLITGFGWLVLKHPNLLEPNTDKLYAKLNDKCILVRYSALITLINLIKQEMVKVRSQVAIIAKLLVDEDETIRNTTKRFFTDISEKGNTLYNVMSDIISNLSNPEDIISEDNFQTIMKFLFQFIKKDRLVEALVDKLCIRLKESSNETQAYFVSYCLVIIKHTDKSLASLSDNISYYIDQLKNPKVYNSFNIIISNNSRMAKPAIKDILSALSDKIEKVVQDEDFVMLTQKTPRKRVTTVKKKLPKSTIKEVISEDEIEPLQVINRSTRCYSKVKRKLLNNSGEEENNEDLAYSSSVSNIQRTTRNRTGKCEPHGNITVFNKQTTRQKNVDNSENKTKLSSKS